MQILSELAKAMADALVSGHKVDEPNRDRFISALGDHGNDQNIEDALCVFLPILATLSDRDWEEYLDKHNLSLDGLVEYRSDPYFSIRSRADISASPEPVDWDRYEDWNDRRSAITQTFENLVGADLNTEEQKVEALGEPVRVNLTIESLPERLRKNVLAPKVELPDPHEAMRLIHMALAAIREKGRSLISVIRCCGSVLDKLFPGDPCRSEGTYQYRQACALVDDYLAQHPDDLEALCWSAELNLLAGRVVEAKSLAAEIWRTTESICPEELSNVFHFLDHDSCCTCSNSISYDGEDYMPGQLGLLEKDWLDSTEPLAQAVLRRAFLHHNWGTSTIEDVHQLWEKMGRRGLPADIMPSECWMWLTYTRRETGFHHYSLWVQTFDAAKIRGEHEIVIRAIPHLVAGALEGTTGFIGTHYNEWLNALYTARTAPGLRQVAVHTVAGLRNAQELFPPPARMLLSRMLSEFAAELPLPPEDAAAEVKALKQGLLDVDRWKPLAVESLGEKVWASFSKASQEYLLQAIGLYWSFWESEGDLRDFGVVFIQIANVIVHEIDVKLSLALRLKGATYLKYHRRNKSLGDLDRLLSDLLTSTDVEAVRDRETFKNHGIQLNTLVSFLSSSQLLLRTRNTAAHGANKIDRERAAEIYGDWIAKGRLRRLFESVFR